MKYINQQKHSTLLEINSFLGPKFVTTEARKLLLWWRDVKLLQKVKLPNQTADNNQKNSSS